MRFQIDPDVPAMTLMEICSRSDCILRSSTPLPDTASANAFPRRSS